jgi:hypothetical protein
MELNLTISRALLLVQAGGLGWLGTIGSSRIPLVRMPTFLYTECI